VQPAASVLAAATHGKGLAIRLGEYTTGRSPERVISTQLPVYELLDLNAVLFGKLTHRHLGLFDKRLCH